MRGYPTLKWFVNGQPTDYNGGRTKKDIVTWINKRMGPPSKLVTNEELSQAIADNSFIVVFIGKEGDEFRAFEAAASGDDK